MCPLLPLKSRMRPSSSTTKQSSPMGARPLASCTPSARSAFKRARPYFTLLPATAKTLFFRRTYHWSEKPP
jgi:hypothetical protein